MGLRSSKVLNTDELTSVCDPLDKKLPPLHTKVKPQRRSLFNADGKEARLDIIRSRMKRGRSMRDDFTIPPKASPPERKTDDISDIFEKMSVNYEYSFKLSFLLDKNSVWGMYQHDPTKAPFKGFVPGFVMDLETCYSNDQGPQINLMKSYIMQIGACGINNDAGDFDVACLLPEKSTKTGLNIAVPTSGEMFENILSSLEQTPLQSLSGYKKVIGMPNITNDKLARVYEKSWAFWEEQGPLKTFENPLNEIKKWKKIFNKKTSYPLLFRIDDALRLFLSYCGKNPVWYAHNGHRFDFIIMEKWFRIYGLNWYCQAVAYPPKTTKAMEYLRSRRNGPNYSVFDSKGYQIGKSPWTIQGRDKIRCYDTMKMFKGHSKSNMTQGAARVSQGKFKKVHLATELGGKEKIVYQWEDGSQTTSTKSHKQQDLITAVGMKGNDNTAHTALYDCLTLRELIYRAFSSEKDLESLKSEGEDKTHELKQKIITKRMSDVGL